MVAKPVSSEMHSGPGFRIRQNFERVSAELVAALAEFESNDISDLQNRLYAMDYRIHNVTNNLPVFGPALTVKLYPGDNLMVHKALDFVQPGDLIVIDASGCKTNAVIGDLVAAKARHLGAAGFIVDGLVRDLSDLKKVGLPVYAKGVCPIGPLHRGPGEVGYAISCGGIVVDPGDAIVADSSGVVVLRRDIAATILERLRAQRAGLADYVESVYQGNFDNSWVDHQLLASDCDIDE